jgi:hypothetical protein
MNADNLTKKQSEKLSFIQNELQTKKKDLETLQKAKADMIIEVAGNGGSQDQSVINAINSAKDVTQVAQAGSKYAGKLDRLIKQAQLNKTGDGIPTVKSINGVDSQYDPITKTWVPVAVSGSGTQGENQRLAIQDKVSGIDSLINSPGLAGSVGPNAIARSSPDFNFFTGVRQDFIAGVQQLVSKDTLDTLINLKKAGGTLGALSEGEGRLLNSAATKIGTWAIKDSGGNVIGYNTSEDSFKKELNTIKTITNRALEAAGGPVLPTAERTNSYLDAVDGVLRASSSPYASYLN